MDTDDHARVEPTARRWAVDGLVFGYALPLPLLIGRLVAHRGVRAYWENPEEGLTILTEYWTDQAAVIPLVCMVAALAGSAIHRTSRARGGLAAGVGSFTAAAMVVGLLGRLFGPNLPGNGLPRGWDAWTGVVATAPVWAIYVRRITSGRSGTTIAMAGAPWVAMVAAVLAAMRLGWW